MHTPAQGCRLSPTVEPVQLLRFLLFHWSLVGSRAGCHAGCEARKWRQCWLRCGLACGISRIETMLLSRRVSLRAEPESQSEARKMSRDSRGRGACIVCALSWATNEQQRACKPARQPAPYEAKPTLRVEPTRKRSRKETCIVCRVL